MFLIFMRYLCVSNVYLILRELYFCSLELDFTDYLLVASRSYQIQKKIKNRKYLSESLIFQI